MKGRSHSVIQHHASRDLTDVVPDDLIIHEIIPRLGTMKSIASLSMASRRFYSLCRFPIIDIDNIDTNTGTNHEDIANYLDKFFVFRTNLGFKFEFRRFQTREKVKYNAKFESIKWVQDALSLNVQELILQKIPLNQNFLKLPFFPLKDLRVLRLEDVTLSLETKFDEWVSNCCVTLEELHLKGIYIAAQKLRITSSSLRVLTFETDYSPAGGTCFKLYVSAPNLVTLHVVWSFSGIIPSKYRFALWVAAPNVENFYLKKWNTKNIMHYYSSSEWNFSSLQSASLLMDSFMNYASFEKLLGDISQIKSLEINKSLICQLFVHGNRFPASWDKLETLHIYVEEGVRFDQEILAVISLLRKAPSLKILTITTYGGDYKPQDLMHSILGNNIFQYGISKPALCLDDNTVKIELSHGENETRLVRSIIKNAARFKKFIISYPC